LDKLLELYREHKGPVHYSDVATRLGVNRFSAYDMLKVLERKGFASSSYALANGHSGPGRSMVLFSPTPQASSLPFRSSEMVRLGEDWQRVRERVLDMLRQAQQANHREAFNDLLARLPEAKAPLDYCTQMIGVLLLNMRRATARAEGFSPFRALVTLLTIEDSGLETLAGLSVGTTLLAEADGSPSTTYRLLDLVRRYQVSLGRLSEEARSALAQFLQDALETLD
jgi:DNA-binding MarR family transcriptional regulator